MRSSPDIVATAIITEALKKRLATPRAFEVLKKRIANRHGADIPNTAALRIAYLALVDAGTAKPTAWLDAMLVRRNVRSLSGVAVVTVLTKPSPCPGRCVYCPSEARMPKSYLSEEPAAARALSLEFDPYAQVTQRLATLHANGHPTDKVELIVKGATWSAYPWRYRQEFLRACFDACNDFGRHVKRRSADLAESQRRNESAASRIVGLTLETRPDFVRPLEIKRLREVGCTRIELGVQILDDEILELVKRGHDVAEVARATRLLRDAGFKVDYHLMPQLPGATPARDLTALRRVFAEPAFRPDMIKIYPCVVLATAELHDWWTRGDYRPYADADLLELLIAFKTEVPRYCRISRLIRDIPSTLILAGNPVTNLRQTIADIMRQRGLRCDCLRCREVGHAVESSPRLATATPKFFDDAYDTDGGTEHFLSFEDRARRAVFAFCRLRLPQHDTAAPFPELERAAIIRELHTYGRHVGIEKRRSGASQHTGLGRRLMAEAERIARDAGYAKLAVIAGIGVRAYYRKLGYRRCGTYMVKMLV